MTSHLAANRFPETDPSIVFELFRGSYGSELLTAAVAHFPVFRMLSEKPRTFAELQGELTLADRPANVLVTALRAFGLIRDSGGQLHLTDVAQEHLSPGGYFNVSDYIGLRAESPGVLEMVTRLKTNRPANVDPSERGAAFIYRDGLKSAMEHGDLARHFTLALAGRAKNVAPYLARELPVTEGVLLDIGAGTGLYTIACLEAHPKLRAIVLDRPEVLKIAQEFAEGYGVSGRIEFRPADMFSDPLPKADLVLLSNVLHDWDVPECRRLIARCAEVLPKGGRLLIHDVFLNDDLSGPLAIALYSAALFTLTEGRAYSAAEYRSWLTEQNLAPEPIRPTLIHCGLLPAVKTA
jgi:SAM-dependent methyltransferase